MTHTEQAPLPCPQTGMTLHQERMLTHKGATDPYVRFIAKQCMVRTRAEIDHENVPDWRQEAIRHVAEFVGNDGIAERAVLLAFIDARIEQEVHGR